MTTRAQQRELAVQTRLWAAFERLVVLPVGRTLTTHMRRAADAYETDDLLGISIALEDAAQDLYRILVPHYTRTGNAFGARVFKRLGVKSAFEEFDEHLMAWIQNEGLLKAKDLTETTMLGIRGIIEQGQLEGLGSRAIANLIRKNTAGISRTRAIVIARTETHNAATFAGQEAARSMRVKMTKAWLAHPGGRTRPTHFEANGQTVDLDETYTVGGFKMMRPGDDSFGAPAGEIVQCRCGEIHEVAD